MYSNHSIAGLPQRSRTGAIVLKHFLLWVFHPRLLLHLEHPKSKWFPKDVRNWMAAVSLFHQLGTWSRATSHFQLQFEHAKLKHLKRNRAHTLWGGDAVTHTRSLSHPEDSGFSCVLPMALAWESALLLLRSSNHIANHNDKNYRYHLGQTSRPNENLQMSVMYILCFIWFSGIHYTFLYVSRRFRSNIICPWTMLSKACL